MQFLFNRNYTKRKAQRTQFGLIFY